MTLDARPFPFGKLAELCEQLVGTRGYEPRGDDWFHQPSVRIKRCRRSSASAYKLFSGFKRLVDAGLSICRTRRFVHGQLADKRSQTCGLHFLGEDKAEGFRHTEGSEGTIITYFVSVLIVPNSRTAPVPTSINRWASRRYTLMARCGSWSRPSSAL